jgi:3-carboxy-cis,cis-muconate cycloisomerase
MPLIDSLVTTDALVEVFSDASVLEAMVAFEVALARAAASVGAIPTAAAEFIARAARPDAIDARDVARGARESATPSIAVVNALRDQVRAVDADSAAHVHWGATSQDVTDTALMLMLARAYRVIEPDALRVREGLARLSDAHAQTVMLGRTLLLPAVPITFGLKVAAWHRAATRSWNRLTGAWERALVVQYGGAAGTRAAADPYGGAIAAALAAELGLRAGPPWHTDRDRLGALVTACGLHTAVLGKIARDIALLMQAEIGELAEAGGGSSTMPQKRNPSGCAVVIASAVRVPGLVAAYLSGMLQEHERGAGGVQTEWATVADIVQCTGGAVDGLVRIVDGLTIDAERMRRNLEETGGVIFAERARLVLSSKVGADDAQRLVATAIQRSRESNQRFVETLATLPEVTAAFSPDDLADLDRPEAYLGDAETLRLELLKGVD